MRVCVKTVKSTLPRWAGTEKLTGGETLSPDVQPSWLFESAWDLHQQFTCPGPQAFGFGLELQGQHSWASDIQVRPPQMHEPNPPSQSL